MMKSNANPSLLLMILMNGSRVTFLILSLLVSDGYPGEFFVIVLFPSPYGASELTSIVRLDGRRLHDSHFVDPSRIPAFE